MATQATTTTSVSKGSESPLLALPPELRTRIYEYAVVEETPVSVGEQSPVTFAWQPRIREPALLHTNRQLRAETSLIYYSMNVFQMKTSTLVEPWFETLGEQCVSLLKEMRAFGPSAGRVERSQYWLPEYETAVRMWCENLGHCNLRKEALLLPLRDEHGEERWVMLAELKDYSAVKVDGVKRWVKKVNARE